MKITGNQIFDLLESIFMDKSTPTTIGTIKDEDENFLAKLNVEGELTKAQFDELGNLGDYTIKRSGAGISIKVLISKELVVAV